MLTFLKDAPTVASSELYYDINNGYIKPEEMLVKEDAKKVIEAAKLLESFFKQAEENGCIEII